MCSHNTGSTKAFSMRNGTIRDPRKKREVVLLRSDEEKSGNLKKLDF